MGSSLSWPSPTREPRNARVLAGSREPHRAHVTVLPVCLGLFLGHSHRSLDLARPRTKSDPPDHAWLTPAHPWVQGALDSVIAQVILPQLLKRKQITSPAAET
jgi:hypothetical protein